MSEDMIFHDFFKKKITVKASRPLDAETLNFIEQNQYILKLVQI